jgi:DNA-binding PadR family transcriptional regulator
VELNATQASLLGFLHGGPATGWDLLEEARRGLAKFWNVTPSHVYRELKALEANRLVRAGAPGPRDRRPFAITAAGRRAFAAWIHEEPGFEQMRIPLLVTMWFAGHLERATLQGFLDLHRAEHERRLEEYRAVATGAPRRSLDPNVAAVVDFGIAYEEAFLAWIDGVAVSRRGRRAKRAV